MPRYRKKNNKNANSRNKKQNNNSNTNINIQAKGYDDEEEETDKGQNQQENEEDIEVKGRLCVKIDTKEEVKDCMPSSSVAIDIVRIEDDISTSSKDAEEINIAGYNDIKTQLNDDKHYENENDIESICSDADTLKANSESPEKEFSNASLSDIDKIEYNVLYPESENSSSFNQSNGGANDDDLTIQEMSDSNSFDDPETPPIVSEMDSEIEKESFYSQKSLCEIVCEKTLGSDWEDALAAETIQHKANEKLRRAQKRSEIESHFLPQLLNPRYLDSITEENSDASDFERKSDKSDTEQIPMSPSGSSTKTNILDEAIAKKATAIFPKSNLDFSKKRKHSPGLLSSKKREETTPSIVEAKIVEQESIEESCSTWNTDITPESETAELVFINSVSASSSTSDLMDSSASNYSETSDTSNFGSDIDLNNLSSDSLDTEILNIYNHLTNGEEQSKINRISSKTPSPTLSLLSSQTMSTSSTSAPPVDIKPKSEEEKIVIKLNNDTKIKNEQTDINNHPNADGISEISNEIFCVASEKAEASTSTASSHEEMNENSKIDNANSISRDQQLLQDCGQNTSIKNNENEEISVNDNNSRNSSSETVIENSSSITTNHKELDRQESLDSYCSEESHSTSNSQCTAISCGSFTEFRGLSEPRSENGKLGTPPQRISPQMISPQRISPQRISPQRQEENLKRSLNVNPLKDLSREAILKMPYGKLILEKVLHNQESEHKTIITENGKEIVYRHEKSNDRHNYDLSTENRQRNLENFVQKSRHSASPPPIPPKSYMNYFPNDSDDIQTVDLNTADSHKNRLLAIIHNSNESQKDSANGSIKIPVKIETKIVTTATPVTKPQEVTSPSTPSKISEFQKPTIESSSQQQPIFPTNHMEDIKRFSHPDFTKDYFQHLPDHDLYHSSAKKRFSNIETSSNSEHFCSQIKQTAPVKHSTFERSTTESIKKIENGKVITDVTNCNKESESYSENNLNANSKNDQIIDNASKDASHVQEVMSDINLKQTTADRIIHPIEKSLNKQQQNHHQQHHIIDENNSSINRTVKTAEKRREVSSSEFSSNDFTYDEFRQRAKELSAKQKSENELFDYDKVLKEFDQLSKLLKKELDIRPSMIKTDKRNSAQYYQSQSQVESSSDRQEKMSEYMRNLTEMKSKILEQKNIQSSSHYSSHDNLKKFSTIPLKEKFLNSQTMENQNRFSVNIPVTVLGSNNDSSHESKQQDVKQKTPTSKEYQIPMTTEKRNDKQQPIPTEYESYHSTAQQNSQQINQKTESHKEYRIPIAIDPNYQNQTNHHPQKQRSVSQPREYQIPVQVIQTPTIISHPLTTSIKKPQSNLVRQASTGVEYYIPVEIELSPHEIPKRTDSLNATTKPKPPPIPPMFDYSEMAANQETGTKEYHVPIFIESTESRKSSAPTGIEIPQRFETQTKAMAAARNEFFSHFTSKYQPKTEQSPPKNQSIPPANVTVRSNEGSCSTSLDDQASKRNYHFYQSSENLRDHYSSERRSSNPNYESLGATSENIAKPFRREVEICMRGKRPNIKAPRLTVSTNDLSTPPECYEHYSTYIQQRPSSRHHPFMMPNKLIAPKLAPLSEEISDHRIKHVSFRPPSTEQYHSESSQIHQMHPLPIGDDVEFRKKMALEWLNQVAEREERRQQKIIKISKIEENFGSYGSSSRKPLPSDIGEEFLRRVKERRTKLCMTPDSEHESGPETTSKGSKSESDETSVKVIEGQSVVDLNRLPKHIRDFARLTSQIIKSHQDEDVGEISTANVKADDGRYPYKEKSNGYMSEPERVYDSDYYSTMYSIDRRRTPIAPRTTSIGPDEKDYGTVPNPVRSGIGGYKMQPGKIEDYAPGHSSLSEKEKMAQRETQKLSHHYTEGNLSRALKEQGYESDSNLIFRKKEESHYAEINPSEQRQSYKNVQSGGEPPLLGFRKPAPEKLKESPSRYIESDVNIHYKTPIRYEPKEIIAEEELARRQAEAMRKLYEEERRQKYLKELQDINSRRHTDNFTASQKSPIALNRYDDFVCDLAPKSPNFSKTIARALFNFQGQTARELTFKKGDLITIRRQIDDNWYEGEYNAMLGLFPVSYVEVISRDYIKRLPKRPSEGQARAKFNFQAQSGIELSLNKGELVTLTRRVDKNWFEGKIANRKGIFPVTYVEVLTDIGAEDLSSTVTTTTTHTKAIVPTKQPSLETLRTSINNELNSLTNRNPSGILRETKTIQKTKVLHVDTDSEPLTYRALYKYRPQNNDELELLEGDLIYVIEKCDDGWYVGSSQRTGCFGTFPGNYVELI